MFGTQKYLFISQGISFAKSVAASDAAVETVFATYIGYFYKAPKVDFGAYSPQFEIGSPFVKVADSLRLLAKEHLYYFVTA